MLSEGDTFLTADDDEELHLWIVITSPAEGEVVTVSVTTRRKKSESLVLLKQGDHPFIVHDSVVAYSYARIRAVDDIETAFLNGTAKRREPVSQELLARIKTGLVDSDFTPNGVRHYFKSVTEKTDQ
ncbi:MAG TPA: hypothetical protein VFK06_19960 [Candidatus Angelobacter sp.]|nr:hypothetical protein [Candidatus Angelobacter sp.]